MKDGSDARIDNLTKKILELLASEKAQPDEALLALAEAQKFVAMATLERVGMDSIEAESAVHEVYQGTWGVVQKKLIATESMDWATPEVMQEALQRFKKDILLDI